MDINAFISYLTVEKRYSPHTLSAYRRDLSHFSDFLLREFEIAGLHEAAAIQVRSYIARLYEDGLQPRSIHRKISSIQSYFRFLNRKHGITANPCRKVQKPKTGKKLPAFLVEDEMAKLEHSGKGDYIALRDQLICNLFYGTGIRLSELTALSLGDIDLSSGTIRVMGKRSKERIVPLLPELREEINCYLIKRTELGTALPEKLFLTEKGKPVYQRLVQRVTGSMLQARGVAGKGNPHSFRHTFATHLLNGGADINAVKELLGHSSLAATQVYTHNTIDKLRKIHEQAHPRANKPKED